MVERTKKHIKTYYYGFSQMYKDISSIKQYIYNKKFTGIYAIPRGGYILGVIISHILKIPMVNKISEKTLICDDICDTGKTLSKYKNNFKVCLVGKPKGMKKIKDKILVLTLVPDNTWVNFWWE